MTRKDYVLAADMIQRRGWGAPIAKAFAEFFAADNPNFFPQRFFDAAGISPGGGSRKGNKTSSRRRSR
jgi:hypothetical protein